MKHRTRWLASLAAAALALTTAATASAYTGQVYGSITVGPQGQITCGAPSTVVATFLDAEGRPVAGQSVAWSWVQSPSADDRINKTPTMTNADGVATTTVTLASVAGTREIRAASSDVQASAVISAACGGLPITSTAPAGSGGVPAQLAALLVLVGIGVAGIGLAWRRLVAAHS